jgi:hypothetical protein
MTTIHRITAMLYPGHHKHPGYHGSDSFTRQGLNHDGHDTQDYRDALSRPSQASRLSRFGQFYPARSEPRWPRYTGLPRCFIPAITSIPVIAVRTVLPGKVCTTMTTIHGITAMLYPGHHKHPSYPSSDSFLPGNARSEPR